MRTAVLTLLILALYVDNTLSQCGIDNYDFSSLTIPSGTDYSTKSGTQTYYFDICHVTLVAISKCQNAGAAICQVDSDGIGYFLGKDGVMNRNWAYVDPADHSQGITLTYINGEISGSCTTPRVSQIVFTCATARVGPYSETQWPDKPCGYIIHFPTSLACGGSNNGNVTTTYKLSGGWIFFIIVMVIIPVYIAVGCGWNHYKHRDSSWKEKCPQWGFWSLIPALVKDGCIYSWRKIAELFRRCFGGSRTDSYEGVT